jgi:nucleoside 2-deoxyribosyltransferase
MTQQLKQSTETASDTNTVKETAEDCKRLLDKCDTVIAKIKNKKRKK